MRDVYTESVIPIVPKAQDRIVTYLLMGLVIASLAVVFFAGMIGVLLAAICGFALYRHLQKVNSEYEYVHTNDVFDVDAVIYNRSRKQLCSIHLDQVVLVARADSDEMKAYAQVKAVDYSGSAGEDMLYAMVYTQDGKQHKLLLQLNESMRGSLKQWIPGRVR